MAERRMFAKTIIDSDAFIDMPLSSQALYFHLCMSAKDTGILNNAKSICRLLNLDTKYLDILVDNKFLSIENDGYFRVIHWYENNGIGETHKKRNNYLYRNWRNNVIDRDKKCVKCGTTEGLEAHHIKHFADYPEMALDLDNGITLCKKCHIQLHKEERNG